MNARPQRVARQLEVAKAMGIVEAQPSDLRAILRDYLREALADDTQQRLNTPRLC
jgi:hypothetical protein